MAMQPQLETVFSADPFDSAKSAQLRYVTDDRPGITRRRRAGKFLYYAPDGKRITDPTEIERINKIGIPPAYREVWICPDPNGHLQATGRDARGRKQYRYHARWQEVRGENKFGQMLAFGAMLPDIRQKIEKDLKGSGLPRHKVMAAVVKLLDTTHIRIGNDQYAKENQSYGLTTIRKKHVQVQGANIRFEFKGKSGQDWEIDLTDKRLADIVRRCESLPGYELFKYLDEEGNVQDVTSNDVNAYLKEITGFDITAKYFRTWAGTVHAAMALQHFEPVDSVAKARKNIVQAVKQVAGYLGNTPAICRKSYIHPYILNAYLDCKFHDCWQTELGKSRLNPRDGLSCEELAVLALLQQAIEQDNLPP